MNRFVVASAIFCAVGVPTFVILAWFFPSFVGLFLLCLLFYLIPFVIADPMVRGIMAINDWIDRTIWRRPS